MGQLDKQRGRCRRVREKDKVTVVPRSYRKKSMSIRRDGLTIKHYQELRYGEIEEYSLMLLTQALGNSGRHQFQ